MNEKIEHLVKIWNLKDEFAGAGSPGVEACCIEYCWSLSPLGRLQGERYTEEERGLGHSPAGKERSLNG